jgi:hypothetical protein
MRKFGLVTVGIGLLAVAAVSAGVRLWLAPPNAARSPMEAAAQADPPPAIQPAAEKAVAPTQPTASAAPGIQWYASWQGGQQEAERLNVPILLVSGTPHCAGVSGVW